MKSKLFKDLDAFITHRGETTKMTNRFEKTAESLDFHLLEEKPRGEPDRAVKISIPRDLSKIVIGDAMTEDFKIESAHKTQLAEVPAIYAQLLVRRPEGYESETTAIYWMFFPEVGDFIGIRYLTAYIERKGYACAYEGPFRMSQKQKEKLEAANIDLKILEYVPLL